MSDDIEIEFARLGELPDDQPILFLQGQADGAIPNGRRVVKVAGDPQDTHSVGDYAKVLSSFGPMDNGVYAYFVEWDDTPGVPVVVSSWKLHEAPSTGP